MYHILCECNAHTAVQADSVYCYLKIAIAIAIAMHKMIETKADFFKTGLVQK